MSTQSLTKKMLVSAIVALPFPYIFLVIAESASVLPVNTNSNSFLSSENSVGFYLLSWFMFFASSLISQISVSGANKPQVNNDLSSDGDDDASPEGAETGTVKWFNVNKGFGFITTDAGEDVFVHFRSIRGRGRRSLRQGQSVRFDLSEGDKGMQAENVSVVR